MRAMTMNKASAINRLMRLVTTAERTCSRRGAHAAAPGITGPSFNLTAQPAYMTQPDGQMVYSWGYGCNGAPTGYAPAAITGASCGTMQVPGPTLIVTEGQPVSVTLTNALPTSAGNTSILFPGFKVTATGGVAGLLTTEAVPGGTVTYTFTAGSPGTRAYYSGTQGDLQVEMGLYGVIIVLPNNATVLSGCATAQTGNNTAKNFWGESDFRLAKAAYDHAKSCYDREYLFQFATMDPNIHSQALAQVTAAGGCTAGSPGCSLNVPTEPYHPAYFMINGRSMPDDMDPNYAPMYPHQPYNGNPHMHPGEQVLLRVVGQGRWQHPFHEHGNHVRILGRDGNLILSQSDPNSLAGPLLFTTTTTPGLAMDGIFYWTGRGLNWDAYGHNPASPIPMPSSHVHRMPTATTRPRQPRSIITSGARITTSRWKRCPSAMWPREVPRRCPMRISSRMAHGLAAVPIWDRTPPCERPAPRAPHRRRARSPILPRVRPALPSCGTRITSVRSPPTTYFQAAC